MASDLEVRAVQQEADPVHRAEVPQDLAVPAVVSVARVVADSAVAAVVLVDAAVSDREAPAETEAIAAVTGTAREDQAPSSAIAPIAAVKEFTEWHS